MQYSQNFYTNVTLFVLALVVLGLSIWAFVAPCKKDGFGDLKYSCGFKLPCPDGMHCIAGVCQNSSSSCEYPSRIPCKHDQYCDAGVCQNLKKPGDKCKNPYECQNNWCIDGQCRDENELHCECKYAVPDECPDGCPILKKVGPGYCNVTPGHIECLHKHETGDAYSYCYNNGPVLASASECIAKLK